MPTQFIGRREELELLARLLDESRGGQGRLVAISGDAGIGKTRLVGEVARLAADWGVEFGLGRRLHALSQGEWNGAFDGSPALPNTGALFEVNAADRAQFRRTIESDV